MSQAHTHVPPNPGAFMGQFPSDEQRQVAEVYLRLAAHYSTPAALTHAALEHYSCAGWPPERSTGGLQPIAEVVYGSLAAMFARIVWQRIHANRAASDAFAVRVIEHRRAGR